MREAEEQQRPLAHEGIFGERLAVYVGQAEGAELWRGGPQQSFYVGRRFIAGPRNIEPERKGENRQDNNGDDLGRGFGR